MTGNEGKIIDYWQGFKSSRFLDFVRILPALLFFFTGPIQTTIPEN